MFNHWAIGLRSGLLPQVVVLQHQKLAKKNSFGRGFREDFDFWSQGKVFWRVFGRFSEVSRVFFTGVSPLNGQVGGEL